mmetsp:Transcript_91082/g.262597  ORF Transcript_91082/g.262597 Transcript_91082/m.262597 type:complete len:222 (+) Transcript_91082:182-847(+)
MGMKSVQALLDNLCFCGTDFNSACSPAGAFTASGTHWSTTFRGRGRSAPEACERSPNWLGERDVLHTEPSEALVCNRAIGADLQLRAGPLPASGDNCDTAGGNTCDDPALAKGVNVERNSVTWRPPKLALPPRLPLGPGVIVDLVICESTGAALLWRLSAACDDARRFVRAPTSSPLGRLELSRRRSLARNLPSTSNGPRLRAVIRTPEKCTSSSSPVVEL